MSILGRLEKIELRRNRPTKRQRYIVKFEDETLEQAKAREGVPQDEDVQVIEMEEVTNHKESL